MATDEQSGDPAAVAHAYFEAVGRRDLDAMTAFYEPGGTGEIHGLIELQVPTSYRAWFGDLFAAFPDLELEVVEVIAAGDKAAVRWRANGTFSGSTRFEGLDPNGARVEIQGCDVLTVRNGRIQRNDAYMNAADLARQLGALPPAGSPVERVMTAALNIKTHLADAIHQRA
ncbi:MAG TPA: ester cyclase [Solirubrobacterales bacterium]|nr:ester cyclase [Solirubrobacterales bacterium]